MQDVKGDQRGVASFIVTFVICIVITLIVVGFSTIARREQRQAIDAQLSSQAFYAAESKINQLYTKLKADPANFLNTADDECTASDNDDLNLPSSVVVTCALATKSGSPTYTLKPDQAVTMGVPSTGTANFAMIGFTWQGSETACRPDYGLPSGGSYPSNQLGMVRLTLTRADSSTGFNRKPLANNTLSAVLIPATQPGQTPIYPNATYDNIPNDYFGSHPTYNFGSDNGVGYTPDEYNRFQKQVAAGKTKNDFLPANGYPKHGPTTPSGDMANVSWMPFWNWLEEYRVKYGATAVPVKHAEQWWDGKVTAGNYRIVNGDTNTSDNNPQYFQEWAKNILNGSNPNYVTRDPANLSLPFNDTGQIIDFQPSASDMVTKPVFFGYCAISGGKAVGTATVRFPTPATNASFQLTVQSLFKNIDNFSWFYYTPNSSVKNNGGSLGGGASGQATFDVTAKAQDVVRRVQVHVSYGQASGALNFPVQALRSGRDVCKLLDVTSTVTDLCEPY